MRCLLFALPVAFLMVSAGSPVRAQRDAGDSPAADADAANLYLDRTPVSCVRLSSVRDTDVIDDRTIVFRMRGRDVYVNVLDRDCIGLESADRFISDSRNNRLCNTDLIRPFDPLVGARFPGASCRLGDFIPITPEEAELYKMDPREIDEARRRVVLTPLDPEEAAADEPAADSGAEAASANDGSEQPSP